jgi:hydrophobe/amphiphile efflux-1 (HAE1) family protein
VNVSRLFIERPIATTLLAAAIVLSGIFAYRLLPVASLPNVDFPTIQVSAALPGASPETMASSVATPLERRFGRIAGITEITSTSTLGSTQITLQFSLDRDVDSVARDVQGAISAAGGELPPNLPLRPNLRKVNPSDGPILILSLTSETLPLPQVFEAANTVLAQKIAQVSGVGQVFVAGGQLPAVRVQVDPRAVAGRGLSLESVRTALAKTSIEQPQGALVGPARTAVVDADDQIFGAHRYRGTIVGYEGGAPVRLSDVADVFDDVENNRLAAWADGTRSIGLVIKRQPGANAIETNERIRALLPSLMASVSPAIDVSISLDRTQTIRGSVHDVERTLLISVLLVVAVVFLFLGTLRATAIPSVAVPLSLLGTFSVMYLLGYSLNNLSLMALTISTGFVVDDAIVVTENVKRLVDRGLDPRRAALLGARQIAFTIVSITASLVAVFLPILLMGGLVGRLFREFAVTLSVAIVLSAVVSLTLTPMMCASLLTNDEGEGGRFRRFTDAGFVRLLGVYERALDWVLGHRKSMLALTLGTLALSIFLYGIVPKGLFPQQDAGSLFAFMEGPQDISFAAMRERTQAVNEVLLKDPDIEHAVANIGAGNGATGNTGNVFIALRSKPQRQSSAEEVIARLRPELAKVQGINVFLQSIQDVRVGGRASRTQFQYTLQDADLDELRKWAPQVLERLKKVPELKDVATDQQTTGLELALRLDRDTAARAGVSVKAIDDALYDAFGQRQVATTYTQLNQYRVILEVKPEFLQGPSGLDHLYVPSASGEPVPLRALSSSVIRPTPLSITHQGQFPSTTLSFALAPGVALGQAVDAIHRAEGEIGLPVSVRAAFMGTAQAFQDSLSTQPVLVLSALLAVYIVLGMLYESYIHPITILSTLPSAGVGALLALLVFGVELSIIALIGIILLIGIVKKNAIMMIDFAIEEERDRGASPLDAIRKACLLRFRPILMTTLAALLGALPLALGSGMGSELRRPLGITIVGGLLVSQLLTLFTTPIVYLALDRFSRHRRSPRSSRPPPERPMEWQAELPH